MTESSRFKSLEMLRTAVTCVSCPRYYSTTTTGPPPFEEPKRATLLLFSWHKANFAEMTGGARPAEVGQRIRVSFSRIISEYWRSR